MKKLYEKNEVHFAIIMIVIYVLGTILAETATAFIGINKLVPALFHSVLSVILIRWIVRNRLVSKYGLIKPGYPLHKVWYFAPLVIVACSGLLGGIELRYGAFETVLFVTSMLFVGFLEEIIFRGFLFVGIARSFPGFAIIVSSVTFGISHIANLFSGAPMFGTIMQIIFASAVGFTLVLLFYKGGSLIPCIVFHSINNSLSAIERQGEEIAERLSISTNGLVISYVSLFVVLLAIYCIVCLKKLDHRDRLVPVRD